MPKPALAQCPTGLADVYAPDKGKACGPTGAACISFLNRAAFAIPDLGTYHIQLDQPWPLHGAVAHVSHFISGCRVVREPVQEDVCD